MMILPNLSVAFCILRRRPKTKFCNQLNGVYCWGINILFFLWLMSSLWMQFRLIGESKI